MDFHALKQFERAADQLIEAAHSARHGCGDTAREQIACALAILQGTSELAVAGALAPWRARRTTLHIEANIERQLRTQDLARLVCLSSTQFCRAFRRRFGMSPRRYVLLRRMELAKQQMVTTDLPLCEIALRCGMTDQSHFTRTFRSVVGVTPFRWRQAQRASR